MKKLLLITGDLAAGKSTFAGKLSARYNILALQKDTVKELLGDRIAWHNREENKSLSDAAIEIICHVFSRNAATEADMILEANFHEKELETLHSLADRNQYNVLTLVLQGDADVLYRRHIHRMKEENRHPVHLSTTLDQKEDFLKLTEFIRTEKVPGKALVIEATDLSYQDDPAVLIQIDNFMRR